MKKALGIALAFVFIVAAMPNAPAAEAQEVEAVNGRVLKVIGRTVVVRNTDTNEIQRYTEIPENVTIYVDGKVAEISDLREGMVLKGLRFTGAIDPPEVITEEQVEQIESAAAAAPAPAPASRPAASSSSSTAPASLPKTASAMPAVGLAGLALLVLGGSIAVLRRS